MPHDKAMEAIIQKLYVGEQGLTAKRMFGGICYLVGGNMAFGIYQDNLIVRFGSPERAQQEIDSGRALPFDITGKAMKGWVMIPKARLASAGDYRKWLDRGLACAKKLPPKLIPHFRLT
jgi:TfoX/Sxy family transcriptional regulator of competence genes